MSFIKKRFEVSKDVYERAKAKTGEERDRYPMTEEDREELIDICYRQGYGIYGCYVFEQGDKYICEFTTTDSCD